MFFNKKTSVSASYISLTRYFHAKFQSFNSFIVIHLLLSCDFCTQFFFVHRSPVTPFSRGRMIGLTRLLSTNWHLYTYGPSASLFHPRKGKVRCVQNFANLYSHILAIPSMHRDGPNEANTLRLWNQSRKSAYGLR